MKSKLPKFDWRERNMNAECVKRQSKKIPDQYVFMILNVINKTLRIGHILSIQGRKHPLKTKVKVTVVDDVNQNGVNTILFDVVLLPPNTPATALPPNAAPAAAVATNLPCFAIIFCEILLKIMKYAFAFNACGCGANACGDSC